MSVYVARAVLEIEASNTGVVECFQSPDCRLAVGKTDLHDLSSCKIAFENVAIGVGGLTRKHCTFEFRDRWMSHPVACDADETHGAVSTMLTLTVVFEGGALSSGGRFDRGTVTYPSGNLFVG